MKLRHKSWVTALLCLGGAALAQPDKHSSLTNEDLKGLEVRVREDNEHVVQLRERSRKSKDVIKLNCVNDKFIQIKALAKVFDNQRILAENAISGGGEGDVFRDVSTTVSDIRKLRGEADACVGEELVSDSLNDYLGPTFPDDPTKGDPFVPDDGIEPPGYASPFQ